MSSTMSGVYTGDLRVSITHGDSQAVIVTDAPKDNNGMGRAFSPTDLFASSLGACMLTIMAIKAKNTANMPDLSGSYFSLDKEMTSSPRRVGRLSVIFTLPAALDSTQREQLERSAKACPVHASLHDDVKVDLEFRYSDNL